MRREYAGGITWKIGAAGGSVVSVQGPIGGPDEHKAAAVLMIAPEKDLDEFMFLLEVGRLEILRRVAKEEELKETKGVKR
mgnify:CR=1 FL=1